MREILFNRKNTNWIAKSLLIFLFMITYTIQTNGQSYVTTQNEKGAFPLVVDGKVASLFVSSKDYSGVLKVAGHLQTDIEKVSGKKPEILKVENPEGKAVVIIGTIGKNPTIDKLIDEGKISAEQVKGKWDTYALQTVENPLPNVDQALVIFGSNKRGTIYGMYDLSKEMGVSPWYYWADVPAQTKETIFVKSGFYTAGEPKVKYRGIFLNDEAPALSNWAKETFGGFNHKFYDKVFELILRNKGNYLWPAMWPPTAFFDDDPENMPLADEYGVVMSTSHHEPMMRSHEEWFRFGGGEWNYETNKEQLQEFWQGGIERMGDYESVVTMGMRGDGDEAMSEGTAVDLLKGIIKDQRKIIEDVTGKPAKETPQVWAIYKEVQDYYDKGMRVDDDILVLLCDDNWGNIRILPKKEDLDRSGGYGIYYHFDFVGGPVSYRWLNVRQIEHVWEQMNLAYEWGVKDLWLVNVGDLKPMELPISFFLDFAWNPENIKSNDLPNYYTQWAKQQFGEKNAKEIGEILALYTKYNSRRTPEMLKPMTYSLTSYREADMIVKEYKNLEKRAQKIYDNLPEKYKSAFYQLVQFPVSACCNVNEMMVAAGKNQMYSMQGRISANKYADQVKKFFDRDEELTHKYHKINDGKWNHMMSQTHLGYMSWNNPPLDKMPAVSWVQPNMHPSLGYVVEDNFSRGFRPATSFLTFDPVNNQDYFVEIFNNGKDAIDYTVSADQPWIKLSSTKGSVKLDEKIYVSIDWDKAPKEDASGSILISSIHGDIKIAVPIKRSLPECKGFIENNGVVSIEAAKFYKANNNDDASWITVPNLGRTASSVTVTPANARAQDPSKDAPSLEYKFTLFNDGDLNIETYLSPTLNYKKEEGLKFAIAVDNEEPQIINMHQGETQPDWEYPDWWNDSVTDHIKKKASAHKGISAGQHTLKVWMIDPGVVFQKFVIDAGGLQRSYLGPPESVYVK